LWCFPVDAAGDPPLRVALVVGHNTGHADTVPLRFAHADAAKMAGIFTAVAQVSQEGLILLEGPSLDELRIAMAKVERLLSASPGPDTEFLFYFSGHADDKGLQLDSETLPMDELRSFLKESKAGVTVAFIDACHSGAVVRDKGGKRVPVLELGLAGDGETRGVAVITSSSAGEKSQESEELRGSFFTHFLASGLRGDADGSGDGRVTLHELYQYAYNKTIRRTWSSGGGSQHPTFDYSMTGTGEVVLAFPGRASSRLVFPSAMEGNYLLYRADKDSVLAEVDKKKGVVAILAVPPGTIDLFRRSDAALERSTVVVREGEEAVAPEKGTGEVSRNYLLEKGAGPIVSVGAKGGYQFFWDEGIREKSILPAMLGGMEVRVRNLLGPGVVPYVEALVGGAASSGSSSTLGPLARSTTSIEVGTGVAWTLLARPVVVELSPEVALFYVQRSVDNPALETEDTDWYLNVAPMASLLVGREFFSSVHVALQVRSGYLYFREDSKARNLGFSEMFLSALVRL